MSRTSVAAIVVAAFTAVSTAQSFQPEIPRIWDEKELERFEVPLAQRDRSPRYMTPEEYYKLKVRLIYRTYPVYAPGREPAGYIESLKQKEPEILFDASKLKTKEDWIQAGKLVFESEPLMFPPPASGVFFPTPLPPSKDGILPEFIPGNRYIIRKKGVLEIGINSCAGCHTRVMPDGSYLQGAQGVVDFPVSAEDLQKAAEMKPETLQRRQNSQWILYGAPWIESKEQFQAAVTRDAIVRRLASERSGVIARQGTSVTHPPHIPSLIGIQDRKYLDSTGLVRHRSIGDLARYAVTNQGLDTLAHYGDFQPSTEETPFSSEKGTRYSDQQLYALGLYLYSLKPPPNPNLVDERAGRGQRIFQQQGCATCHTPPLYTNNKLTPALGFRIPDELRKTDDILDISVGTDPTLALRTRRGTGFYKVPSLRGVWYRNAFGHGGWVDTLEEWFDPARLKEGFAPKGIRGVTGPVRGHEFGLRLSPTDREALIAFLRTL
ncbi:MAG TPA: di-heme oxidoredictase family protein [Paludibaculum sp.]|jgi:hypothetical protein